jgi:hypothetical protein
MAVSDKVKKKVLAFHGIDADTDDDASAQEKLLNAVTPDDLADLENRAEAGDAAREELANRDLEKYANRIGTDEKTKKFFRDGLLTNRKETLEVLESMPEPKGAVVVKPRPDPVHVANRAGNPGPVEQPSAEQKKEDERAKKVANRARELRAQNPTLQNRTAFDQAESEIPAVA